MIAKITFKIQSPNKCTEKEFLECLKYELSSSGEIDVKNPLIDDELDLSSSDHELTIKIL